MTGTSRLSQLQLSPPPPSSLVPVKSRLVTFWYQLTQVHLEKEAFITERQRFSGAVYSES